MVVNNNVSIKQRQQDWINLLQREAERHPMGVTQNMFLAKNADRELPIPKAWVNADFWDYDWSSVDFRTILWNEIIFDIDFPNYKDVYNTAYRIIYTLKKLHAPHYIYPTSGKGLHISVFLDVNGRQNKVDWNVLRMGIFNYVRSMAFVPDATLNGGFAQWGNVRTAVFNYLVNNGVHSPFDNVMDSMSFVSDMSKVRWSDNTLGSMVRCEGGGRYRKELKPDGDDDFVKIYKGWVFNLPTQKVEITEPWEVLFPPYIKEWQVPEEVLDAIKEKPVPKDRDERFPRSNRVPPCIQNQIEKVIKERDNLTHFARYAIVTHLWRRGWSKENIHDIFRNSPDYSERITTYMINDIISKNYVPPSCKTLQSQGICNQRCYE